MGRQAAAAERRQATAAALAGAIVQVCLAAALVGAMLALAVTAVAHHHTGRVMVAVLPLAALGAFESVPLVGLAVARALSVRDAATRLLALDQVPLPVVDPAAPNTMPPAPYEVAFEQASLRYDPHLPLALDGVTLRLVPGSRVAVTGSSGAGKSSLISALLRFWPLAGGTLRVGSTDAERLRQSDVRALSALADQAAHLFAGTLRANLTLGQPEASPADIAAALDAAQLSDWVAQLPQGLETPVGDEGVALSGGERRRLAVARALLAQDRPLLLLDEPTSGLQAALAEQVAEGVLGAAAGRTVLLVTHRAAEADRCDHVLTLEHGTVVSGSTDGEFV